MDTPVAETLTVPFLLTDVNESVLPPLRNSWKFVEEAFVPIGKELIQLFFFFSLKYRIFSALLSECW